MMNHRVSPVMLNFLETASLKTTEFATLKLPPLIIMHGLLGSQNNFRRIANNQQLSKNRRVICVDLRNHGASPHSDEMSFDAMAADVIHLMDHLNIEKSILLGHSLGGKVAMTTGLRYEDRIAGLIVADMAPVDYTASSTKKDWNSVKHIVTTVTETDPSEFSGRKEIEDALEGRIPDLAMRQFVTANFIQQNGVWKWKINTPILYKNLEYFASWPLDFESELKFSKPALFVSGGKSTYMMPEYHERVLRIFPAATFEVLAGAGHWIHADKPKEFIDACGSFLRTITNL